MAFIHGLEGLLHAQSQKKTWRLLACKRTKMSTELQIRIIYGLSHERSNPIFIATKMFIVSNGTVAHKKYHSMKILQIRY